MSEINDLSCPMYIGNNFDQHIDYCTIVITSRSGIPEVTSHGFIPSENELDPFISSLKHIFEIAPSDSVLQAWIKNFKDRREVHIHLRFINGELRASGRGSTLESAIERSFDQIYSMLRNWKKNREIDFAPGEAAHDPSFWNNNAAENSGGRPLYYGTRSPHVLIVDDNPISTRLIESCLRQQGCKTKIVEDGERAVTEITSRPYDLVVLDWVMPKMSGAETVQCAQDIISYDGQYRMPWFNNMLPVITYTGIDAGQIDFPECEHFEYMGSISKSASFHELKEKTSQVLESIQRN